MSIRVRGRLILIVGPSGSGKGSVIEIMKKRHPEWVYPISYTTREIRPGEVADEVYHFIPKEKFEKGIDTGKFLEYAIVHSNNYYGTGKEEIMVALYDGKVVVREVDIQGFKSICKVVGKENLVAIFLMVNSVDDLIARILKRGKLPKEEIQRRMESAQQEINQSGECDFIVPSVTGQVKECADRVEEIILNKLS